VRTGNPTEPCGACPGPVYSLFATLWSLSHIVRRPTDRPAGVRERAHTGGGARDPVSAPALVPPARGRPRRPVVVVPVISLAVISVGSLTSSHVRRRPADRPAKRGHSAAGAPGPGPARGRRRRARGRRHTRHEQAGSRPSRAHMVPAHRTRPVASPAREGRSGGHGGASVTSANRVAVPNSRLPVWDFNLRTPIPNHVTVGAWWGSPNRLSARPRTLSRAVSDSVCQSSA